MKTKSNPKSSKETVLILRTCDKDRCSHGGFVWPESGEVAAPDWNPKAVCGYGLHGLLWGDGDASLLDWDGDAKWLVAEVEADSIVDLGGKVKFPKANVIFCGDRVKATELVLLRGGKRVVGAVVSAGDFGTATAGDRGTISILWWDDVKQKYCCAIGEVGENGIEAGKPYVVRDEKLVKKDL